MIIRTSKRFDKQLSALPSHTRLKFLERVRIFKSDPDSPALRRHPLKGEFRNCWSINVTGDVRALYVELGADMIEFVYIGTHSELYGK